MGSLPPSHDEPIKLSFPLPSTAPPHEDAAHALVAGLGLQAHIEGGFFVETDRDPLVVPSPWPELAHSTATAASKLVDQRPGFRPGFRNASTTIYYLLTPRSPLGAFHRNRGRTVHTLHRGRGRYVVLHPPAAAADEWSSAQTGPSRGRWTVETFVVGGNVDRGERLQWIVEGGRYKASFLLPDDGGDDGDGQGMAAESGGLLISETVVPGFEYCDHDFLTREGLDTLVDGATAKELECLVRRM
jgi:uncharacterized protein